MLWVGAGGVLLVIFLLTRNSSSVPTTTTQQLPAYNTGSLNPWSDVMPDLSGTGSQYNAPLTGGAVGNNPAPYQYQNIVYGPIDPALRAGGYMGAPIQSMYMT